MGPLNLKLILQAVDRWSGPTNKASGSLGVLIGKIGGLTGKLAKVSAIGAAAGVGAAILVGLQVGKAAWGMVKEAADAGDASYAAAQKVGLSVVSYQRLAYAAKMANMGVGEFEVGLAMLSNNAVSAAQGGKEDAKAFKELGVRLKDAKGQLLPTEEILGQLADRFSKMPDGPLKTAMAMRVLGRSGKEMIPFLNQGRKAITDLGDEAQRLGVVMTEDQAKAADEFNDNLDRMKGAVFGLKVGIGTALLPTVNSAIVSITKWISAHRPEIMEKVNIVVGKLTESLAKVDWVQFAEGVANAITGLVKLFEWIGGLDGIITGVGVAGIVQFTVALLSIAPAIAAMLGVAAGPVGWIILAIGAIATGAWLLYRNWDKVSKWFGDMWKRVSTTFREGAANVWNALPGWLKFIFKGVAFAIKFGTPAGIAATAISSARKAGAEPRAAVGPAAQGAARAKVDVGIKVDQDGRVRQTSVSTRPASPGEQDALRGLALGGW